MPVVINEVEKVIGDFRPTEFGISHAADNDVFLHHPELTGEMLRAIGVLRKRTGSFDVARNRKAPRLGRASAYETEPFDHVDRGCGRYDGQTH